MQFDSITWNIFDGMPGLSGPMRRMNVGTVVIDPIRIRIRPTDEQHLDLVFVHHDNRSGPDERRVFLVDNLQGHAKAESDWISSAK